MNSVKVLVHFVVYASVATQIDFFFRYTHVTDKHCNVQVANTHLD